MTLDLSQKFYPIEPEGQEHMNKCYSPSHHICDTSCRRVRERLFRSSIVIMFATTSWAFPRPSPQTTSIWGSPRAPSSCTTSLQIPPRSSWTKTSLYVSFSDLETQPPESLVQQTCSFPPPPRKKRRPATSSCLQTANMSPSWATTPRYIVFTLTWRLPPPRPEAIVCLSPFSCGGTRSRPRTRFTTENPSKCQHFPRFRATSRATFASERVKTQSSGQADKSGCVCL